MRCSRVFESHTQKGGRRFYDVFILAGLWAVLFYVEHLWNVFLYVSRKKERSRPFMETPKTLAGGLNLCSVFYSLER